MKPKIVLILLLMLMVLPIAAQQTNLTPQQLADPDGQFMEIDGVEIYFMEYGEKGNPAVILFHGFGGSTFTWRDNMQFIADNDYHVIAFDRPPYGLSDKKVETDYSPAGYASLTVHIMDALEVESAVLVGHSAGGQVIAQFALDYPERVNGLMFVAGAVGIQEGDGGDGGFSLPANINLNTPFAERLISQIFTPERFAEILTSAYYDPSTVTPEIVEGYGRALRVEGWEKAFIRLFSSERTPFDVEALADVEVPTLLIWGEEDTWVPLTVGERLLEVIPGAVLVTYDETGHLPMEEQIDQFNEDLLAFLQSLE